MAYHHVPVELETERALPSAMPTLITGPAWGVWARGLQQYWFGSGCQSTPPSQLPLGLTPIIAAKLLLGDFIGITGSFIAHKLPPSVHGLLSQLALYLQVAYFSVKS